jgi:UDP-4-amino-4,6-dideoxy-N-acetyl-beta-L-altrosamine N-acetyltransferase
VLVLADNQRDAAKHLQEAGIANAFEADETGISNAATSLRLLLSDPARRRAMTGASISLVDGRGAERCAQAILNPTMRLRPVGPDDEQLVHSWRNEALVRAVSRTTHEITAAQHHAWFSTLLQDEDRMLLIAEIDGEAVGMVRLDPDGAREIGAHKISIILGHAVRGRGLAKQIIERAIWQTRVARASGPLYAEIKKDNARSEAVFSALGFAPQHPADAEGFCLSPIIALRRMTPGDAEQVREWRTHREISRHMFTEPSITLGQQVEWVSNAIADENRHYWIIELDGVPVGLANMLQIDLVNRRGSWAFYLADPATRGNGVGKAVEFAIIEYAFGSLALNKLCCEVLSTNTAVLGLHQKFGFSREGVLRQHILKGDTFYDITILGMLASDWITHRPRHLERFRELGIVPPVAR